MSNKITCDWCHGEGQSMTDCGYECCDHCGGSGKIKIQKSEQVRFADFDGDVANGLKIMIPTSIKITCGMNMFNQNEFGDKPLLVVNEVLVV